MTEDEFKYKLQNLFQDKINQIQDLTLKLTNRLKKLPVKHCIKKEIESEIKNKISEYENDETKNIQSIKNDYEQQIAIILNKKYIIPEYREILFSLIRHNFIDNILNNQNNMMSLRMEYIEFNLLARESFYRTIICNETVAIEQENNDFIVGKISFDAHHHGGSSI